METIKKDLPAGKPGKTFDAVKMMRDIRDKVSAETQNMSFAELKACIQAKLKESKLKPIGE